MKVKFVSFPPPPLRRSFSPKNDDIGTGFILKKNLVDQVFRQLLIQSSIILYQIQPQVSTFQLEPSISVVSNHSRSVTRLEYIHPFPKQKSSFHINHGQPVDFSGAHSISTRTQPD